MVDSQNSLTVDQLGMLREEIDRQLARRKRRMRVTGEALRPVELDQTAHGVCTGWGSPFRSSKRLQLGRGEIYPVFTLHPR